MSEDKSRPERDQVYFDIAPHSDAQALTDRVNNLLLKIAQQEGRIAEQHYDYTGNAWMVRITYTLPENAEIT